jgi:hypothetical protein
MKCYRCEGLMVQDTMLDMEETGGLWIEIWRCVQCGNAEDPRINRHRLAQYRRAAGLRNRPALVSA